MDITADTRAGVARRPPLPLILAAVVPAALVLVPIGITVADAAGADFARLIAVLWRPLVGELLLNTVMLTVTGALCCTLLGTATALLIERTDIPFGGLWTALATAPLAIPAFIASYAWVSISASLEGFAGALIVTVLSYTPLVFLPVAAALRGLDPALEEIGRTLGHGPWRCLFRIMLPQLRPAMQGGALLVALNIMVEFGAFALMRFRTFTTEIYTAYRAGFDGAAAEALAVVLLTLCVACITAEALLRRRAHYARIGSGTRRRALRYALGRWRLPALAAPALLAALAIGVPVLTILFWMTRHGAQAITPAEASPVALLHATLSTIELGIGGALLTTLLALPIALLSVRWPRFALTLPIERSAWLAQGVPGIVIALALITATARALPFIYQSTFLLLIGYVVLFLPFPLVALRASLLQIAPRLEEIARTLGANWFGALWRIVIPLAAPGFTAAAALVFIAVSTELTATLLLAPIGTQTLAIQIWNDTSSVAFAAAAPYAAVLVALSMAATWVLGRRFGVGTLSHAPDEG
ncbi:MAG: iron ABC transporter permease [Rhodospirillales bacterium]|nr:iron ABC transporter permease [Rhodospirillales bacterium]